jgi:hypothetical protein
LTIKSLGEPSPFTKLSPSALIWPTDADREAALSQLASDCGYRVSKLDDTGSTNSPDFLLAQLSSISVQTSPALADIALYLSQHRTDALIWTDINGLDDAFATLPTDQCHFIIGGNDLEAIPILSAAHRVQKMNRVNDKGHDVEYGALNKMSFELAEFARTLARIAEQDDHASSAVSDKPVSFRPAPTAAFKELGAEADNLSRPSISPALIRGIIKQRRLRDSFFPSELFADPAWDILLDLMAARLEGKPVSVSSLCIAAAVPPTTALRWITAMTHNQMLVRQDDPDDARRVFIGLSDQTAVDLEHYLIEIQRRAAPSV